MLLQKRCKKSDDVKKGTVCNNASFLPQHKDSTTKDSSIFIFWFINAPTSIKRFNGNENRKIWTNSTIKLYNPHKQVWHHFIEIQQQTAHIRRWWRSAAMTYCILQGPSTGPEHRHTPHRSLCLRRAAPLAWCSWKWNNTDRARPLQSQMVVLSAGPAWWLKKPLL